MKWNFVALIAAAIIASPLPASADVVLGVRIPVGAAPATPAPVPPVAVQTDMPDLNVPAGSPAVGAPLNAGAAFAATVQPALATPSPSPLVAALRDVVKSTPSCNSAGAAGIMAAAQIFNAGVVSNARRHGSHPATSFASSSSFIGNLAEYAAADALTFTLTRRWSCPERAAVQFTFGFAATNNAAQTEFPR